MRALACTLVLLPMLAHADVYTLGSSYTWDGFPEALDDSPQWHIDCGRSLVFIYEHPWLPCVGSSHLWPTALAATRFDAISFQPVPSDDSILWKDLVFISLWLTNQPTAGIVIQQTWPLPGEWESVFHGPAHFDVTNRSRAYGYVLTSWLRVIFPERSVTLTYSNEMLDRIYHDCANGACPLSNGFGEMFRDVSGHMSQAGMYLQHNALRGAFGQPLGVTPPPLETALTPEVKAYLDDIVVQYAPEPGAHLGLLAGASLLGALARRRRSSGRRSPEGLA